MRTADSGRLSYARDGHPTTLPTRGYRFTLPGEIPGGTSQNECTAREDLDESYQRSTTKASTSTRLPPEETLFVPRTLISKVWLPELGRASLKTNGRETTVGE
jgi:hypothetical protein